MKFEPWDDSHAPLIIYRTDPTGRYVKLEDGRKPAPIPRWMIVCYALMWVAIVWLAFL